MVREDWLAQAVLKIDECIFCGEAGVEVGSFQIACAKCGGQKNTEVVFPTEFSDESFFPPTITVDYKIKDIHEMILQLAHACVKVFFGNPKGQTLAKLYKKYGFEKPYKQAHAGSTLDSTISLICERMVDEYGEFPGYAVIPPSKPEKEPKFNKYIIACPDCGFSFKMTKSTFKKYGERVPTCGCGTKMQVIDPAEEASGSNES